MSRVRAASPQRVSAALGLSFCAALVFAAAAVGGCGSSHPLQAVRLQQAGGDFEGSIEPLRGLLSGSRDDPEVLYRYGLALGRTGRPSLAGWSLRKAMQDPNFLVPAGLQVAYGELHIGNRPEAIAVTTLILAAHPDNLDARLIRANAYARSPRQYEKALADVDRILELEPEQLAALEPRILALIELERIDEVAAAMEDLGRRIDEGQLGAGVPAWHCVTTAIFADESGQPELAVKRWEGCLELYPAHPNVVTKALDFYNGRGEFDRSIEILRSSLAKNPSARQHRVILAELLRQIGESAQAEELLR